MGADPRLWHPHIGVSWAGGGEEGRQPSPQDVASRGVAGGGAGEADEGVGDSLGDSVVATRRYGATTGTARPWPGAARSTPSSLYTMKVAR